MDKQRLVIRHFGRPRLNEGRASPPRTRPAKPEGRGASCKGAGTGTSQPPAESRPAGNAKVRACSPCPTAQGAAGLVGKLAIWTLPPATLRRPATPDQLLPQELGLLLWAIHSHLVVSGAGITLRQGAVLQHSHAASIKMIQRNRRHTGHLLASPACTGTSPKASARSSQAWRQRRGGTPGGEKPAVTAPAARERQTFGHQPMQLITKDLLGG